MKFLSKDPEKALVEVKEELFDRLNVLRQCLKDAGADEYGYVDPFDIAMNNEVVFIENLLDKMERS